MTFKQILTQYDNEFLCKAYVELQEMIKNELPLSHCEYFSVLCDLRYNIHKDKKQNLNETVTDFLYEIARRWYESMR